MNQWIWITGASSGIGEALAKYYVNNTEHNLIISARSVDKLEKLKELSPERVNVIKLDLASSESIDEAYKMSQVLTKSVDLLINNGGISQRELCLNSTQEVERKVMEVNFFGTTRLSKHVLRNMVANKKGHIAVVTSLVGKFGTPYRSAYSASKHALHGYFDSMRAEHSDDNIFITMICPGFIKTNVSINALTGDGTQLGEMDQAQENGMSADIFAKKMANALERKKLEAYIGGKETNGVLLKRLLPGVFAKVVAKAKVR